MRLKATQAVYEYYQSVKGDRLAPSRGDIDPARLKGMLPDIFMLEQGEDGLFRFRLAGTRVCTVLGQEVTGLPLSSVLEPRAAHRTLLAAGALLANKSPLIAPATATDADGERIDLELAMMPLYSGENVCDRIFASLSPLTPPLPIEQRIRLLELGPIQFLGNEGPAAPDLSTTSGQVDTLLEQARRLRIFSSGRSN